MDPAPPGWTPGTGLLRVRGDGPARKARTRSTAGAPPRARDGPTLRVAGIAGLAGETLRVRGDGPEGCGACPCDVAPSRVRGRSDPDGRPRCCRDRGSSRVRGDGPDAAGCRRRRSPGSSACAEMDPLLRAGGGWTPGWAPPRARRWTPRPGSAQLVAGAPRVRGDDRRPRTGPGRPARAPPRARRWTSLSAAVRGRGSPACAEMDPAGAACWPPAIGSSACAEMDPFRRLPACPAAVGLLRVRGDGPARAQTAATAAPPRARRWTPRPLPRAASARLLRVRGDGPIMPRDDDAGRLLPRARRWTRRAAPPRGPSACAEMVPRGSAEMAGSSACRRWTPPYRRRRAPPRAREMDPARLHLRGRGSSACAEMDPRATPAHLVDAAPPRARRWTLDAVRLRRYARMAPPRARRWTPREPAQGRSRCMAPPRARRWTPERARPARRSPAAPPRARRWTLHRRNGSVAPTGSSACAEMDPGEATPRQSRQAPPRARGWTRNGPPQPSRPRRLLRVRGDGPPRPRAVMSGLLRVRGDGPRRFASQAARTQPSACAEMDPRRRRHVVLGSSACADGPSMPACPPSVMKRAPPRARDGPRLRARAHVRPAGLLRVRGDGPGEDRARVRSGSSACAEMDPVTVTPRPACGGSSACAEMDLPDAARSPRADAGSSACAEMDPRLRARVQRPSAPAPPACAEMDRGRHLELSEARLLRVRGDGPPRGAPAA